VLIVSNSAGTKIDAGEIQAESVSHHLAVPVLRHSTPKPGYACISSIRAYFSSLRRPIRDDELIVVGDRVFTDVVLAKRMSKPVIQQNVHSDKVNSATLSNERRQSLGGPLSILTIDVFKKESMVMRFVEKQLMGAVERWTEGREDISDWSRRFVREPPRIEPSKPPSIVSKLLSRFSRA